MTLNYHVLARWDSFSATIDDSGHERASQTHYFPTVDRGKFQIDDEIQRLSTFPQSTKRCFSDKIGHPSSTYIRLCSVEIAKKIHCRLTVSRSWMVENPRLTMSYEGDLKIQSHSLVRKAVLHMGHAHSAT